ncbi:MAG: sulfite exporter TauE/SafE family protein [Rhodospirillales bacterium]
MDVYLPIAEVSVNVFLILGMGGLVGFLSGLFGVGGGFLMTPLLIFVGIPSPVAVATEANQLIAASISGVFAHWRRRNVDFKMGGVLLAGGIVGSSAGVWLFTFLRGVGQIDFVIRVSYVIFLSIIGVLMMIESFRALTKNHGRKISKKHHHIWLHGLPWKMRFRRSQLYISAFLPLGIGFIVGVLAAIMGVGGGFIMVPAMIYLLGMPTVMVAGTSLFQIIFVAANVTLLQSINNQTVDVLLALLLLIGSAIGAQYGARAGIKLKGEQLRALLALVVLGVCGKLAYDFFATPGDTFTLGPLVGH